MDDDMIVRLDPVSGRVLDRVRISGTPLDLDVDRGTTWVPANATGTLWRVDGETGNAEPAARLVPGIFVAQVLLGSVWVLDFAGDELYRISAQA